MCPQNGIKHKAAITVRKQCFLLLIAALCFIPGFGYNNEHALYVFYVPTPQARNIWIEQNYHHR